MAVVASRPRPVYQVDVRDYTCVSAVSPSGLVRPVRVQSPHLRLEDASPPYLVRPVDPKGRPKDEKARFSSQLVDDIRKAPYVASAHGVFISDDDEDDVRPVWVAQQQFLLQEELPLKLVDLWTVEPLELLCSLICWVPTLRRSDGGLVTLLLAGKPFCVAVHQVLGAPQETRLIQVHAKELAGYDRIEEQEQELLFDQQLAALRASLQAPAISTTPRSLELASPETIMKNVQLLRLSALEIRSGIASRRMSEEDLEVPGFVSAEMDQDADTRSSTDYSSDEDLDMDDFDVEDKPLFARQPYCCKYSDLAPSIRDPAPSHRHMLDSECSLGSQHQNHCIFADFSPDECVITSSGEPHEHCRPIGSVSCVAATPSGLPVVPTVQQPPVSAGSEPRRPAFATGAGLNDAAPLSRTETFDFLDELPPLFPQSLEAPLEMLLESIYESVDFACPPDVSLPGEAEPFAEAPEPPLGVDCLLGVDFVDFPDLRYWANPEPPWLQPVDLDHLPSTPTPQDIVF